MTTPTKHFDYANGHLTEGDLLLLVSDDDSSDQYRAAATHLESCETCQSHLTTFVADPGSWQVVQSLSELEQQPRWEPDLSRSLVSTNDAQLDQESTYAHVLKLLGAPNHPEMLGRLGRYDIEQ